MTTPDRASAQARGIGDARACADADVVAAVREVYGTTNNPHDRIRTSGGSRDQVPPGR